MEKKKVAIVTIQNSSNYGAMLQTYALQQYLINCGCDVTIINYDNRHMSKGLDVIRYGKTLLEVYYTVLDVVNFMPRKRMIDKFKDFSKDYFCLTGLLSKETLLNNYSGEFDVYISGSDQIWNPKVTQGEVDAVYFCGMATPTQKVIAYASSCGGYKFDDDEKNKLISAFLEKYSAIATRESSYIRELENLSGKQIRKVLDPVFLLNKEEWKRHLSLNLMHQNPYILVYAMSKHDDIIKKVLNETKGTCYDVVMINQPMIRKLGVRYVIDAGPKEFLELFYNASFVVTNSFHGTAFALIFNKPLQVINNARNMNRISDLLSSINLSNVLVNGADALNLNVSIDYEKVNQVLRREVVDSKEYLERELSDVIK